MSTSNHATATISVVNPLPLNDPLTVSQRHKASVLIEPPAAPKKFETPTVESNEDYAPSVPLSRDSTSVTDSIDANQPQETTSIIVDPPVVWTSGCSQNPQTAPQAAFVALDFTLPAHLTPQPTAAGALAPVLPYAPASIESEPIESATIENPQNTVETPTPKPSEDSADTPTPKPMETTDPIAVASALGYSSTFTGAPSRSTGTSPPTESYVQSANHLSYSQAASGKAFSESNNMEKSALRPYAGPSYATVTGSVAAYAGPSTAAVSYTSAI